MLLIGIISRFVNTQVSRFATLQGALRAFFALSLGDWPDE
jgi:hypothetical protein